MAVPSFSWSIKRLGIVSILFLMTVRAASADPLTSPKGQVQLLVKSAVPLTPDVVASISARATHVSYVWPEIRAMAVSVKASKVDELRAHPWVDVVEPDVGVAFEPTTVGDTTVTTVTNVQSATPIQTWNQDMADTPGSGFTGSGVTVAVVDAGLPQNWQDFLPPNCVDLEHAVGFGAEGWGDFHSQVNAIRGVGGHIGLFPHGLAVSSVIVGFPSEVGPIGGAASGARILPVRVINQFNFSWFSWMTAGILYVGNLKASGAIPGPLVINFSIQAHGSSQVLRDAIDYAIAQGVVFVTIAGNFNPDDYVSFPGRLPESITAGAAGWRSEGAAPAPWFFADVPEGDPTQPYIAPFSGREPPSAPAGSLIDVVAPGSFVFGEWLFGPGFSEGREVAFDRIDNFIFGTSFAAPHVAGIVAQMLEKNPTLNQHQVEDLLRHTALHLPDSPFFFVTPLGFGILPWDGRATGAGLVQGAAAVAATPVAALALTNGGGGIEPVRTASTAARSVALTFAGTSFARVVSGTGRRPVIVEWGALASGAWDATVFDAQGRAVRHWRSGSSGSVRTTWDGRGDSCARLDGGVYFVRLQAAGRSAIAKAVLLED